MGVKYVFNPTTGNLDATSVESPAGSDTQVQFNDGGSFGGDSGLVFNKTTNKLTAGGDIELNDGGSFTTTVQTVTPTANRTISFPDATGTLALVGGSSTQVVYNNGGALAGISTLTYDGTTLTTAGRMVNSYTSIASTPAKAFTGTWFTGGSATTTKPHLLLEPSGTTSTAWSTSGTGFGVNAASGFAGNLLDLQLNAGARFSVAANGSFRCSGADIADGAGAAGITVSVGAGAGGVYLGSARELSWSDATGAGAGSVYAGTKDLRLARDAANTLAQRNSTNAQTTRLYNTFTDASNYERLSTTWSSNVCYTRPENAGTGSARLYVPVTGATTVASLPSASTAGAGARAFVTDANATTFLSTVAGGGANKVPVVSDGTNWLIG